MQLYITNSFYFRTFWKSISKWKLMQHWFSARSQYLNIFYFMCGLNYFSNLNLYIRVLQHVTFPYIHCLQICYVGVVASPSYYILRTIVARVSRFCHYRTIVAPSMCTWYFQFNFARLYLASHLKDAPWFRWINWKCCLLNVRSAGWNSWLKSRQQRGVMFKIKYFRLLLKVKNHIFLYTLLLTTRKSLITHFLHNVD